MWLTLSVPGWQSASAGQFALLQPERSHCFLPRAFSVAEQDGDQVSFLIAEVGCGTLQLGRLSRGDKVWVTGPLGNGFPVPPPGRRAVAVGGGVGAAPFPVLLSQFGRNVLAGVPGSAECPDVVVLLGFRDQAQARGAQPVEKAAAALAGAGGNCRVVISTEDGSQGTRGLVTDLVAAEIVPGDVLFVCGPHAMCEAIWDACRARGVRDAWFSLEAGMACGTGSCYGCAVLMADGTPARVCHDGPVFTGERVYGQGER
jgi:dihydroorotate dehydrogenase electron transfer subunit